MNIKIIVSFIILSFSFTSLNSYAGIVLSSTRLIFEGNKNEAVMSITNPDKISYLVQSWVSLDGKKSSEFIVTPPLFRIDGEMSNVLRIVLSGRGLPQDKESLFWLNVKAIPPSDPNAKDTLLIAMNTKIKLIYRPTSLINRDTNTVYEKLIFKIDPKEKELIASNSTGYYVNLANLTYNGNKIENPGIVAPFSETKWKVKSATAYNIEWSAINDFGGTTSSKSQRIN